MMEGQLKNRDGKLYVVYSTTEYGRPTRVNLWWRVVQIVGNQYNANRPSAGDTATSRGGGQWSTHGSSGPSGGVSTGTGSTQAEFREEVEVPPPASRGKELRWQDGRWEKLMASGWVPAGEGKAKASKSRHATRAERDRRPRDIEEFEGLSPDARRLYDWMIAAFTGDVNEALALAQEHGTGLSKWAHERLREAHVELKDRGVLAADAPDLKKETSRHHATKKSPAQLQREIDEALARSDTHAPRMAMSKGRLVTPHGYLTDYKTGEQLRPATADEERRSRAAAKRDGGRGVIKVDGLSTYVS